MADALFGRRERLAFVAGALVLCAIVLASAWFATRTGRDLNEAARSQEVRAATIDLLEAVTAAETGQRGFLLTGKPDYLAPYEAAVKRVPALLDQLNPALGDDPDFLALRAVVRSKLAELAHTVALAKAGQAEAAMQIVQSDFGENTMLRLRALSLTLTGSERRVLMRDIARSQGGAGTVVMVDAAALVLLVFLAAVIVGGARRYVEQLRTAQASMQLANAELARGRERLEFAVVARTAELSRANEEIQRFAYIVSHDLRAPLLNIIGFTSELESAAATLTGFVQQRVATREIALPDPVREASEQDVPEAIRFIRTSTAKMDRLINAILRLSREGRRVLVPERIDMAALLAGIIDTLQHQAAEKDASVQLGQTPPLVSDRIAVEQVFSNLLENALKYLQPGRPGAITIAGRREGPLAIYTIEDNGRGIAARDLERVFELFRRAGPQDVPGEGIGLAHVRALVRRMGGSIDCESTPGVGSRFTIRLPAVLAHAEETE